MPITLMIKRAHDEEVLGSVISVTSVHGAPVYHRVVYKPISVKQLSAELAHLAVSSVVSSKCASLDRWITVKLSITMRERKFGLFDGRRDGEDNSDGFVEVSKLFAT